MFDETDRMPSAGMGLLICKGIIENHCGKLSVENNSEGGITVSVRLSHQYRGI
ncbi:MAG: hypothetical protein SO125_06200 [Eubacteriales bacterium]|nr:hypothetical protein [Eubacteriales bacterium]MDY4898537.1 hypothetical protein [Eubacteriales bacterium]